MADQIKVMPVHCSDCGAKMEVVIYATGDKPSATAKRCTCQDTANWNKGKERACKDIVRKLIHRKHEDVKQAGIELRDKVYKLVFPELA